MSDLDNAINSINASAAKAENTATFLDDMSTFDDQSSVTNPNNGQTVASIPKQVKDRTDELFSAAESDINQAVADAEQSATDAQDAADSIGRYQGLWPDTGGSAYKGDTYQTQVSGTPTGQYFTALQDTTVDPVGDDVNWRAVVSFSSISGANLLSNHNFLIQTPDDSQPSPSATPTSYPPGHQIFSGVFANETTGITNLTYIDGRVSFSGGDFYMPVANTGGVERLTEFAASVADFDGKPRTRGVSYVLVGNEYRVTVGVDALEDESANETLLGSVKFEQGKVATGHEAESLGARNLSDYTDIAYKSVDSMLAGSPVTARVGDNCSTGGTVWKRISATQPALIDDFKPLSPIAISDFGVVGDGVTDDSGAINTTFAALKEGYTVVFNIPKVKINNPVSLLDAAPRLTIDFNNCEIVADGTTMSGQIPFTFEGVDNNRGDRTLTAPNYTLPSTPPDPNTYMLGVVKYELNDASGIEEGDWLQFYSTRPFDNAQSKETYEVQRVWEVNGNTVYVGAQAKVAFVTGDTVQVRQLTDGITIKNGRVFGNDVTNTGIMVRYFNHPVIENIDVRNCFRNGIYVQYCCQDVVRNCTFKKAGIPTSPEAGYQGDYGYGLIHSRNCYSNVYDCVGREGWHSFEAADGQRDITYHDCATYSDGHGFSTHQNCVQAVYLNCFTQARLPSTNRARYVKYIGGYYEKTSPDATFGFGQWEMVLDGLQISTTTSGDFIRPNDQDVSNLNEPAGIDVILSLIVKNCVITSTGPDGSSNVFIGNENTNYVEFCDNTLRGFTNNEALISSLKGEVINCKGNSFVMHYNGSALNIAPGVLANVIGNTFYHDFVSTSLVDMINIRAGATGDINIRSNIFNADNVRYFVRSYVASPGDIDVTIDNNVFNAPCSRGVINKMTVDFSNNIWHNSVSVAVAYNTSAPADTVLNSSTNDFFKSQNSVYGGTIPTSAASVSSGFIYSNAGVLTVKP